MILPNAPTALIEQAKIVEYVLNAAHPDNGGKAAFFAGWGFSATNWRVLAEAIREMVGRSPVVHRIESSWGRKYVVDGALNAPNGITPTVRTVRIENDDQDVPRLVTAYPGR